MRIAIVTGASSGMGREFVTRLDSRETFDEIWLIARRVERLQEAAATLRAPARCLSLDLTQEASLESFRSLLSEVKPEVAYLINAGGFGKFDAFTDIPLSEYISMIRLNDEAVVSLCYDALPYMKSGSAILNIASMAAFEPVPYINVYAATKAFVCSFTRGLGAELRPKGIRVMAVSPFWTKTEFFYRAVGKEACITYFSRFMTAEQVVTRAFRDLEKGKDLSVPGFMNRVEATLVKILPHKLVMRIWLKQQRKPLK